MSLNNQAGPFRFSAATRALIAALMAGLAMSGLAADNEPTDLSVEQQAQRILDQTNTRGGLVVHLGCADGRLTAALAINQAYLVHGLDPDAANVVAARRRIESQGLYGRVSAERLNGARLPYIDNLVNLLVVDQPHGVSREEMLRVLTPGGVLCVRQDDTWTSVLKPRPDEIDDWGHFLYNASNNPVSTDRVIGPPRRLQWICPPAWSKHHERYPPTIPVLVSSGGRVFYFEDETPPCFFNLRTKWFLTARDAFNGTLLWRLPVPQWLPERWPGTLGGGLGGGPADYKRRLVAVGDRLFVTLGAESPVVELDAATGQLVRTLCDGATSVELLHDQGTLYIVRGNKRAADSTIAAFDVDSGDLLWETTGGQHTAVHADRLFFLDRLEMVAIHADDGRQLWRRSLAEQLKAEGTVSDARPKLGGPLRAGAGIVLIDAGRRVTAAVAADDGRLLWVHRSKAYHAENRGLEAYIIGGLVWVVDAPPGEEADRLATLTLGLDPLTGGVEKTVPSGPIWNVGHHRRCYPGKATERFLIYSRRGTDFLEIATGQVSLNNWTRGACGYGLMPSNGLLYNPPNACRCYSEVSLRGLHALAPAPRESHAEQADEERPRLEQGPAFDEWNERPRHADSALSPADWPTFRHDSARSGCAGTTLPSRLARRWRTTLSGKVTSPVVADGKVFVASPDAHAVRALDAADGRLLWSHTAGGRIDSPPTITGGLALFGSADGHVTCLAADDGRLVWRFRAARRDLRLGANGQLESVWPVHGSVLVENDVAYFAAGRCSFVDGGIDLYGLDVASGRVLYTHNLEGPHTGAGMTRENPSRGFVMPGAMPDVLVSDGQRLYMRHLAFDFQLREAVDMEPNFYQAPKRTGEEFGGDHKYWCDLLDVGLRAFVGHPEWDHRSYFNNFPGRRLYSTTGLLDDSWHIRSYWSYGQVVGQYLVFDGDRAYAVRAYPNAARWASYQAGDGYELYAGDTRVPQGDERLYALNTPDHVWSTRVSLRPKAMALAGDKLLLAGPPDPSDPVEALAALEGKLGSALWVVSTIDGRRLAQYDLDGLPLFDGMAVAGEAVYISTAEGQVLCLAAKAGE